MCQTANNNNKQSNSISPRIGGSGGNGTTPDGQEPSSIRGGGGSCRRAKRVRGTGSIPHPAVLGLVGRLSGRGGSSGYGAGLGICLMTVMVFILLVLLPTCLSSAVPCLWFSLFTGPWFPSPNRQLDVVGCWSGTTTYITKNLATHISAVLVLSALNCGNEEELRNPTWSEFLPSFEL